MAAVIKQARLESEELVSFPADMGKTVLPYLPGTQLYQMETDELVTFTTWTKEYFHGLDSPFPFLYRRMIQHYMAQSGKPDSILFLCNQQAAEEFLRMQHNDSFSNWDFLFRSTRPSIKQYEYFYLYRIYLPHSLEYHRRQLERQPDSVPLLNNAAWLVAVDSQSGPEALAEAVARARQAVNLTGGTEASSLDTLAVALAAAGEYDGAMDAGARALVLAEERGDPALAETIKKRLVLFRAGKPYRE